MKLSDALHMPPALAGVTLLALGNGAPDISSILVGVFTNKVDFAIGDPIGGGLFDTALVMGVIPFVAHVRVSQLPFIRDVVFYLISVSYIFYIFMDNRVTLYEGVICIVIYIIYVLVVIIGRFINVHVVQRFRKKKGEPAPEQSSEETPQTTVEQESSELPEIQIDPPTEDLKTSDVPVITIQVDPPSDVGPPVIKTSGDDWTSGYTVQRRLSQDFKRRSEERRRSTELTEENLQRLSQDGKISLSPPRESLPQSMTDFIVPTVDETPADEPQEKKKLLTLLYERFCDLTGWDGMKWYERVLFVVIAWFPNLLQNLTIPKVDEKDWNRFYIVCVPIFAPLLVLYATGDTRKIIAF
jgi:sodium/potassium/calcium exchanger 6